MSKNKSTYPQHCPVFEIHQIMRNIEIIHRLISKSSNKTKTYEIRNCDHSVSAVTDHTCIIHHGNLVSTLMMDAANSSEISVNLYKITWRRCHIPEDGRSSLHLLLRLRIRHLKFFIRLFHWVIWRRNTYTIILYIQCHVQGRTRDENYGFYFGWSDLLALWLQSLSITFNTALSLIYTLYSSLLQTH
jgi:hypothetical protein